MNWKEIITEKGFVAKIPFDTSGSYCPVCGYLLGKYSFYHDDGERGMYSRCNMCHNGPVVDDSPPMVNGVYSDYTAHVSKLRAIWFSFEGCGESALSQAQTICSKAEIELSESISKQLALPILIYWQILDENSSSDKSDIGVVLKRMLNTSNGKFLTRYCTGKNVGTLFNWGQITSDKIDQVIESTRSNSGKYLSVPPKNAIWI